MFETANRLILAGVGLLSMTRERAEHIFDEYVRRGQAVKGDRDSFVSDLLDSADKARRELEEMISRQIERALSNLDIVRREDLARVESKIDILLARGRIETPGLA